MEIQTKALVETVEGLSGAWSAVAGASHSRLRGLSLSDQGTQAHGGPALLGKLDRVPSS